MPCFKANYEDGLCSGLSCVLGEWMAVVRLLLGLWDDPVCSIVLVLFGGGGGVYLLVFKVQSKLQAMKKIPLSEYATKYNPKKNRRGHAMSEGYLYRLIRENEKGINKRDLWFDYELTGEKDRIFILIKP